MQIRSIILSVLAFVFVPACTAPVDSEDIAEAESEITVYPDLDAIKAAIGTSEEPGATYNPTNKSIVIDGVDNYLRLANGVWSLSTSSAAPSRKIYAVTFDRILVGLVETSGDYDNTILVGEGLYLPNQETTTDSELRHTLVEGTYPNAGSTIYARLGDP